MAGEINWSVMDPNTPARVASSVFDGRNQMAQQALQRAQLEQANSVNELSRFLLVSRQNLAGLLGRLERDGLIERATSEEDRRSRKVKLTAKGEQLWTSLAVPIHAFYDSALKGLSFDDRLTFIHFINLMQKNMSEL